MSGLPELASHNNKPILSSIFNISSHQKVDFLLNLLHRL